LLNSRLSEMADNIELAEEQIWQYYAAYTGMSWNGEIHYPDSFSIRDTSNELDQLLKVYTQVDSPKIKNAVAHEITELMDLDVGEYSESESDHPTTTDENRSAHIQSMLMEGYSNEQILAMHPEITLQDIVDAGADAARSN
jgi:hypothetical protein